MIAYAQSPTENSVSTPPETTITSNTELVQVPVVIRKGREHVSGLTQADFTVLDGGRRQKLAFVKTTDAGVVLRHVAGENVFSNQIDTAGETPRVTVFVVDSANIPFCRSAAGARFVAQVPGQRRGQPWADSGGGFPGVGCACGARFHLRPNVLAAVADYGYGTKTIQGRPATFWIPGSPIRPMQSNRQSWGYCPVIRTTCRTEEMTTIWKQKISALSRSCVG